MSSNLSNISVNTHQFIAAKQNQTAQLHMNQQHSNTRMFDSSKCDHHNHFEKKKTLNCFLSFFFQAINTSRPNDTQMMPVNKASGNVQKNTSNQFVTILSNEIVRPALENPVGHQSIRKEILRKRPHPIPNVHRTNDADFDENVGEEDVSGSKSNQKRRKRVVPNTLPTHDLKNIQRVNVEQALALQTEANSLLKVIISQNNKTIDLLKNLVEK